MNYQQEDIESKNIDHLGIIAGIIDEIGIVKKINELFSVDSREKVNTGEVVKAIILNGLGFVSRPLYLFPEFFKDKAVEHLIGAGIQAEDLNDDKIGRVMDKIYKYGLTKLFLIIALEVVKKYGIDTKYSHLDSSSLHLHGKYDNCLNNLEKELGINREHPIIITQGYSRDHRPDLKQCILDLIVSSDGDIPLFFRGASGNESDKAVFAHILVEYSKQIDFKSIMVADSALYSESNLKLMSNMKWISRVPLSIKKAKNLVKALERGFRFIKDPLFFADSLFVKNPERVETMMMLMALSLLVYNLGQRQLRMSLKAQKSTVKNQLNKPTESPTLRWIFQCFQGIHLLMSQGFQRVLNLTESHFHILQFLPNACQKYYLLT